MNALWTSRVSAIDIFNSAAFIYLNFCIGIFIFRLALLTRALFSPDNRPPGIIVKKHSVGAFLVLER